MKSQPFTILKELGNHEVGLRFERIGRDSRFQRILELFRQAFPLADGRWIDGRYWWILQESQIPYIYTFAGQYGLKVQKGS